MEPSWIYATPSPMPFTHAPYQCDKGLTFVGAVTALEGRKTTLLQFEDRYFSEFSESFLWGFVVSALCGTATTVLGTAYLASPFSQELPLEKLGFWNLELRAQPLYIVQRGTAFDSLPQTILPLVYGIVYPFALLGASGLCKLGSKLGWGNLQRNKVVADINRLILSLDIFKDSQVSLPESHLATFYQYLGASEKAKLNFAQLSALYDSDYTTFKVDFDEGYFSQSQRCYWHFYEHFREASLELQREMLASKRNILLLAEEPLLFERVVRAVHDTEALIPILAEIFDRSIIEQLGDDALSSLLKVIVKGSSFIEIVGDIASSCKLPTVDFSSGGDCLALPYPIMAEYFPQFKRSCGEQIALPEGISLPNLDSFFTFVALGKIGLTPSSAGEDLLDSETYQLLKVACFFKSQEHIAALVEHLAPSFADMLRDRSVLQLLEIFTKDGLKPLSKCFERYYSQTHLRALSTTDDLFQLVFHEAFERPDLPECKKVCQELLESGVGFLVPPNDGSAAAILIHKQTILLNMIPDELRLRLDPQLETITENWLKQHPRGIEDFWHNSIGLSNTWLQKIVHKLYRDHPEYFVHAVIPCDLEGVFIS